MLGAQEVILILAIVLLVFGPSKLPQLARELGKALAEFNRATSGLMETITSPTEKDEKGNLILEVAKKLSVNTEGKTSEQLTTEVMTKILNKSETSNLNKEAT